MNIQRPAARDAAQRSAGTLESEWRQKVRVMVEEQDEALGRQQAFVDQLSSDVHKVGGWVPCRRVLSLCCILYDGVKLRVKLRVKLTESVQNLHPIGPKS